ncbi:MAG: hypothetical protein HYS13_18700 [Planctomycetia bacterium]|nr:hypothetical protein [Planctomycetia bacterium]
MPRDSHSSPTAALFTQVEVAADAGPATAEAEQTQLLRDIIAGQDRHNELLEELVTLLSNAQRQRHQEMSQWKQAHPRLVRECKAAADVLGRLQNEYLARITRDIADSGHSLDDSEFLLNEFIDRYGPRLAHLHSVLQVLSQLGNPAERAK